MYSQVFETNFKLRTLQPKSKIFFRLTFTVKVSKLFHKQKKQLKVYFFSIVGAEVTYTQFLFTYAQRTLGMSRDMCTLMVTVFWICFCAFRLLATLISRVLSPRLMITVNLSACIISSVLLYFAFHPALIWISVGLFGEFYALIVILQLS